MCHSWRFGRAEIIVVLALLKLLTKLAGFAICLGETCFRTSPFLPASNITDGGGRCTSLPQE